MFVALNDKAEKCFFEFFLLRVKMYNMGSEM